MIEFLYISAHIRLDTYKANIGKSFFLDLVIPLETRIQHISSYKGCINSETGDFQKLVVLKAKVL